MLKAVKTMVATGKPPLPYAQAIEAVAVSEAARKAHNKAKALPLSKIR